MKFNLAMKSNQSTTTSEGEEHRVFEDLMIELDKKFSNG
jgi:hypothetical protein